VRLQLPAILGFALMFAGIILAAKITHGGELMKPLAQPPSQKPPVPPAV